MATTNAGFTEVDLSSSQKTVVINGTFEEIDNALNATIDVDAAAGGTIVVPEASFNRAIVLKLTGAPAAAFAVSVPANARLFGVNNQTGQDATIQVVGAAGVMVVVASGEKQMLHSDAADVIAFGAAGGGGGMTVIVEDEDVTILAAASTINFKGAGVTVTDAGSGQVDVDIPGGGGGGADVTSFLNPGGVGYRLPFITATAVGTFTGDPNAMLNSQPTNSFFWPTSTAAQTLGWDFGEDVVLEGFHFVQSAGATNGTWEVQYSDDDISYTPVSGANFTIGPTTQTTHEFTNTVAARYWRIELTGGTSTSGTPFVTYVGFKISGLGSGAGGGAASAGGYFNGFSGAEGSADTTGRAIKGRVIVPDVDITISHIGAVIDAGLTGESFRALVVEMTGPLATDTAVTNAVETEADVQAVSTSNNSYRFKFATPQVLTAGTPYFIGVVIKETNTAVPAVDTSAMRICGGFEGISSNAPVADDQGSLEWQQLSIETGENANARNVGLLFAVWPEGTF